jgi:hypothetical protein
MSFVESVCHHFATLPMLIWPEASSALGSENARVCHITAHFDDIDDPGVARTLRGFLYARLNFDIPGHRTRLPPGSIRQLFNRTSRFLVFVAVETGTCDLAHRSTSARRLSQSPDIGPATPANPGREPAPAAFYLRHISGRLT